METCSLSLGQCVGIIATALFKKKTLKVDLYRDPAALSKEDALLGIEPVGDVFAAPLAECSGDEPSPV